MQVLGLGTLVAAAGVSYYFARKSIKERRKEHAARGQRPTEKLDRRARVAMEEKQRGNQATATKGSASAAGGAVTTAASDKPTAGGLQSKGGS
ncbi:uncharacterized protein LAESUDRAFT_725500 [Laetiporus sulphureus 93-53]|uniref:Uncharacterized protein n=1 Tax=Laetiporus sulphureus 93-53 TaxID=1314785 RepID=A0A165EIL0_9APHY|nr:uncharacterized protein LAESUDRAFT_725500 [Laetiporus sulphureus 93-53]KZT07127.1 hypothetical protein LAESUDRAFT_725500 [Laetiporus sulphureus 93-53]